MGEITIEEYKELLNISNEIRKSIVDQCIHKNSLTLQTAIFACSLANLSFFLSISDGMKLDNSTVVESLKSCIDQLYKQIKSKKDEVQEETAES
jgi:hypothetical protein